MKPRALASRPSSWLLLQALVLSATVAPSLAIPGPPSLPTAAALHSHGPRQDVATSTSTFNWWPYPSWGATTSTTPTADASTSSVPTPTVDPSDPALLTSSPLIEVATSTTSGASFSFATSSTSDAFIHITALPPANSMNSVSRARNSAGTGPSKPFNVAYLAPLFAILGAVAGALCTWLLYRCVPSGGPSRRREQSLEPGPRYTPPSRFRQAATLTPGPPGEENLARPSQSSAHPLLDTEPTVERKGSWISRAFSTRSRAVPPPVAQPSLSADAGDEAEDDPFLDRRSAAGTPATARGVGRRGTTRTTGLTSPDPYGALGDEEELAPYETLRHKSIRRGILERLRLGTIRRPPAEYERGETEEEAEDGVVADLGASPSVKRHTGKRRGHKRDSSDVQVADMRSRTTSSEGAMSRNTTNRSESVVSPPGFRLVVEDPESGALMTAPPSCAVSPAKEDGPAWGWTLPWQPSPTKQRAGDDKFTALPLRRSQADKRSTPYASPSPSSRVLSSLAALEDADVTGAPAVPPISRVDSSILPASPPMVRSPPLDSQLFFGAVSPNFGSNPSLDLRLPELPPKDDATSAIGTPHNKLKTQRSPPPLPFPSTASTSPFRGRLKKTPTKKTLPARPATVARNESADSVDGPSTTGRGTPAQRHDARSSALNRVSEILSRGWSERQLVGVGAGEGVRSPFLGGAAYGPEPLSGGASVEKLVDEEALNGAGIEQRLAALRDA